MRAQAVNMNVFVFDFDDTLVTTDAKIKVFKNKAFDRSLTPKEFSNYKLRQGEQYDFSDFRNPNIILKAKKHKAWHIMYSISNLIKKDQSVAVLYILTARNNEVKSTIYEFLKQNNIEIEINNVLTIGDVDDISLAKQRVLSDLTTKYTKVFFFDDDIKNIKLAKAIHGVEALLVENLK